MFLRSSTTSRGVAVANPNRGQDPRQNFSRASSLCAMAPANGSSKSRKVTTTSASASTSTGSGTVVGQANKSAPKKPSVLPALPLPYIKRQATPVSSLASTSNASSNKKKSNKKKNEAVAAQTGDNQSANSSLAVGQESSVEATGTAQAENPQLTNTTSTGKTKTSHDIMR